jgi:methionyl-tRNA formyltransferase
MILETLNDLDNCLANAKKQPEEGVAYAKKISKESCRINWNDSAENISRHINAFSPVPAAWTEIDGLRLKIFGAKVFCADSNSKKRRGLISENMIVACETGSLKLTVVQPSGKNKMSGEDFIRGRKDLVGKIAN